MTTIREMVEAGVHFGHRTRYWNPKMAPYIYDSHSKVHIIDLEQTLTLLEKALQVVQNMATRNEKILFVGTKRAAGKLIKEHAERCGMPYINERWLGGMLTNYKTIRKSVSRLEDLELQKIDGTFDKLTKKEALGRQRKLDKLNRSVGGIKDMKGLPNALFILDIEYEKIAVAEAKRLGIPIIAIADTNGNPDDIDHIIPGNDDSMLSIKLYVQSIANAVIEGTTTTSEQKAFNAKTIG